MRDAIAVVMPITSLFRFISSHPMRDAILLTYLKTHDFAFISSHPMRDAIGAVVGFIERLFIYILASHEGCYPSRLPDLRVPRHLYPRIP